MWKSTLSIILCASWAIAADNEPKKIVFQETFETGLGKHWKEREFEGHTRYRVVRDGTNHVVQAEADSAASGLGVDLKTETTADTVFSWDWKIEKIPEGSGDYTIEVFDHTARVFIAFDTFIGFPRTINYVWGNDAKPGEVYDHPNSGRAKFIVLQQGNEKADQWITETRNVWADYRRLFGDDPPKIAGIGFMTDTDSTKTSVMGWYDNFVIRRGELEQP